MKKMWMDETGQAMTEYGLLLGLITIAAFLSIFTLRGEIVEMFEQAYQVVASR
ncbi:MAG TPA: Flp family type IVb pilin [Bacillus sp. (in: firmicutes)]|uniref:Flp family type IVb pilin n=1 Tax=Bacillus litorisediminis TaxID=2922713 RepID=UPI001FAD95D8|nr:Flp family type IVb pilin [Bacillus litorisediminis]HWO77055.1 Flp family type IVb pilin [Bacillus sp. (in: firmicutes)]